MKIHITEQAQKQLNIIGQKELYIDILKGGCFGYRYSLNAQPLNNNTNQYQQVTCNEVIINILNSEELDIDLTIDYMTTLIKSGFEVRTNLTSCCCNKSFGFRIDKKNCLTN